MNPPDLVSRHTTRCAFEGIEFPAMRVHGRWGHDSVKHVALLRPGADIETAGEKPYVISVEAVFVNTIRGWDRDLYPTRFKRLLEKLRSTPKGVFQHPTRGRMNVHVDDVDEPLDAKRPRNGALLNLQFTEINASASVQLNDSSPTGASTGDPSTAVLNRAATVDTVFMPVLAEKQTTKSTPSFATPELVAAEGSFTAVMSGQIDYLESASRTLSEARASIAIMRGTVELVLAAPILTSLDSHDLRVALEALRVAINEYEDAYVGDVQTSVYVVPTTMSIARVAAIVYGDPSKASLIRAANQIANGLFIPANTSLVIIPVAA
jgi:prophage DNA circulation protein